MKRKDKPIKPTRNRALIPKMMRTLRRNVRPKQIKVGNEEHVADLSSFRPAIKRRLESMKNYLRLMTSTRCLLIKQEPQV
jgi:hypothetical protein